MFFARGAFFEAELSFFVCAIEIVINVEVIDGWFLTAAIFQFLTYEISIYYNSEVHGY
jgi:hypothetical protein